MTSEPRFTVPAFRGLRSIYLPDKKRDKGAYHQRYLEETTQFILILYTCFWVHETTLIRDRAITSNKNVFCNCLPENLNLEDISNNFFGLPVYIWVDHGDVIVARDNISQCRETFFDTLNRDSVR